MAKSHVAIAAAWLFFISNNSSWMEKEAGSCWNQVSFAGSRADYDGLFDSSYMAYYNLAQNQKRNETPGRG